MEAIQAAKLIEVLNSSTPKKIGILDNNTISFLAKINRYTNLDNILMNYDLLLIPNWVYEEVKDSEERVNYIESIFNKSIQVYTIDEIDYEELAEYKSGWLYKFFLYSSFMIGELKSFIKRSIEKNHTITVLSNDRGTYDFIKSAKLKLLQDKMFERLESSVISFKSNDFIIKESYLSGFIIKGQDIYSIVEFRDEKRVKDTRNALDNSIEEHDEVLSNEAFMESLKDNTFNIIF